MSAGFSMLLAKLSAIAAWFGDLFIAVFVALWDILKDIFSWLFEQVLGVAVAAIATVDVSTISGGGWGALPADILNIMAVLGVGEASVILIAALTVRMLLQLIPFVRLGS